MKFSSESGVYMSHEHNTDTSTNTAGKLPVPWNEQTK